jgi:hypothetical protein
MSHLILIHTIDIVIQVVFDLAENKLNFSLLWFWFKADCCRGVCCTGYRTT